MEKSHVSCLNGGNPSACAVCDGLPSFFLSLFASTHKNSSVFLVYIFLFLRSLISFVWKYWFKWHELLCFLGPAIDFGDLCELEWMRNVFRATLSARRQTYFVFSLFLCLRGSFGFGGRAYNITYIRIIPLKSSFFLLSAQQVAFI